MELSNDPMRKPIKTRAGLYVWGYKTRRELAGESVIDGLTGLLNRKGWDQKVAEVYSKASRTGEDVSIIVIDLDDFKTINDKQGHKAGDEILIKMATALKKLVRSIDVLARYGGDEMVICLPATNIEGCEALKQKIVNNIRGIKFSIGIGQSFEQADINLYKMKSDNKNG